MITTRPTDERGSPRTFSFGHAVIGVLIELSAMEDVEAETSRSDGARQHAELRPVPVYSDFPLAACPFKRNVFGSSPSPQILKDPKSLYQGP
jgi:hypothetical protein